MAARGPVLVIVTCASVRAPVYAGAGPTPMCTARFAWFGMGFGSTVNVAFAAPVLPALSVAVQVTVVVPSGKSEPEAGVQLTGSGPSTASVAVAV